MKRDLTDAFLRTLTPPESGRVEIRDTRVQGLTLRLTKGGAASWSVRALTRDGKHTRPRLGTYPALGLAEARKAARRAQVEIQGGADPVADKREARETRERDQAEPTVADRLAEWQAVRAADPRKPWSDSYAYTVAGMVKGDILPALGKRRMRETTRPDWVGIVEAKRKSGAPAMAALLYRVASAFLNHAEAAGWIAAPLLPRKGAATLAPPPAPRARTLSDAELAEVWQAAGREAPKVRAFIRLLLLTAAREGEVAGIEASECDLAAGLWSLPATRTKNGQGITLPLAALASAELHAVWPNDAPDPDHRLLGRFASAPLQGFAKIKARVDASIAAARAKAGAEPMPPWRWHDLRRTARTGMTRLGVPRDHAEAALNHLSFRSALERTYDRHDYREEILAALRLWQAHVAALVSDAAPVVALAEVRRGRGRA
jgi:integrase